MLGIGAIEVEEATYSLGMCGHIVVRVNGTRKRYRLTHSMSDGWNVSEPEGDGWSRSKRVTSEEFIALLPQDRGLNYNVFIGIWAGYAAGYERGRDEGRWAERDRLKHLESVKA